MLQKGLLGGSIVVAAAATFAPDAFGSYALVLVVLGLVMGLANPIEDVAARIAIYVLPVLLPRIADNLDVIPVAGEHLNGILSQFALVIAGVAIANFCFVLYNSLMAAGNDSDDGAAEPEATEPEAAEPEATEPEAAEPEAPSWGGDNSGDDDSDDGAAEPEAAEPEAPSWGGDNSGDDDSDDGDDEAEDTRNV